MLPMTAGLIFVGFAIVALVLELSLLGASYRDVATVADLAAEAGASVLVVSDVYDSEIALDVVEAEIEARRVGSMWGSGDEIVTIEADLARICVTVTDTYRPQTLVFIGVTELAVSARGCAEPRAG
jgi:SpoU rRNA methylase family enzyme